MAEVRLEIEGLCQRLCDRARIEQFVVYVEPNITLHAGDFVALLGPSGCGKTTLLSVLGLLRAPTDIAALKRFKIWTRSVDGSSTELDIRQAWQQGNQRLIEQIRRRHFGFALQSGELVSSLTVSENIAVPLRLNELSHAETGKRVNLLLEAFRLRRRLESPDSIRSGGDECDDVAFANEPTLSLAQALVNRLSGGEYQRVALARAIAHAPTIAFVDEPTAALNRELARGSLEMLRKLQASECHGQSAGVVVMITHDEQFAAEFSNVIIRMAPRRSEAAGEVVEVTRVS